MFRDRSPEDLRALLLHMAAAASEAPDKRAKMIRWFRAGLEILEDEGLSAREAVTPQQANALREISDSLGLAAEHAAFLATQAEAITQRSRPR